MKRIRRTLLCLALALCLLAGNVPVQAHRAADSGTWGKNISWSYDAASGRLTISGSGEMMYENVSPNWLKHKWELRSVTVQEGITNLCDYAFNGCVLLTDVSLPKSLKSIDSRAFAGCESLRKITLPAGLYSIGSSAFQDCVALESITLPQGLYAIGPRAFQNCDSLTAIDIPGSVKNLGGWFLAVCDQLRTVTLHPGLETVGQDAFRGLGVDSLTLPDTVQTIENSAFEGCSVRSITLSANLKYIGFRAFLGCGQLTALTLPASVEDVAANAFDLSPIRILVVRNPQCHFSYDEHNIAGIAGLFGFGGADVYGYPGSTVQQILERFPDSGYTFKPLYFDDVAPGIWYYDAVSFAKEHALFQGVGDRAFAPESAMSRAMVVQVLYNYAGNGAVCPNPFTDVPDSAWYARAVAWAAREGLVNGVGEGRFAPEASVTREQFAAIMYRFTSWQDIEPEGAGDLSGFPDAAAVSDWASDAMAWAVGNGILTGSAVNGVNYLRPKATATRAQVAAIMMRCLNLWDSRTHTDVTIRLACPKELLAPLQQAAADYSARNGEVRVQILEGDLGIDETEVRYEGADAVLIMDETFQRRMNAAGTASAELLYSPYVFMIRASNPASASDLPALAEKLPEGEMTLGLPAASPCRSYATSLLAEAGLRNYSGVSWRQVESMTVMAFEVAFRDITLGPGTEFYARREHLAAVEGTRRPGQGEALCAYWPEGSPKQQALEDFFAALRDGTWSDLFEPLGLYVPESET